MTFNFSHASTRRQWLKAGLILGAGAGATTIAYPWLTRKTQPIATPIQQGKISSPFSPSLLRPSPP